MSSMDQNQKKLMQLSTTNVTLEDNVRFIMQIELIQTYYKRWKQQSDECGVQ